MSEQEKEQQPSRRILLRLYRFILPHMRYAVVALVFLMATTAAELALPQVAGGAINRLQNALKQGGESAVVLWPYVALFLTLTLAKSLARLMRGVMEIKMQQGALMDLRCALFEATQNLSFDFHDEMNTGQLVSRVTHDVDRARRFFSEITFSTLEVAGYLTGALILVLMVNVKLSLLSLATAPPTIFLVVRFGLKMRPMWKDVMDKYGELTTTLQENIAGARVVRAFAKEPVEIQKFSKGADTFITRLIGAVDYWAGRVPLAECLFGLSIPIALCYGSVLAVQGRIEVGDIAKLILYLMGISQRMNHIGRILGATQEAAASADRIFGVLDKEPKVRNAASARPMPDGKGRVEFQNVSFQYTDGRKILDAIHLDIDPGRKVAIVGRTGAGKTAFVNLIPRFYDVTEGRVLIDGEDVRSIDLAQLRRSVGLIFQETFLFSATVAENIAYGKPDATREEIERCARAAQAHGFITELDKGYDTMVGERGVTLSGGQKQRVAIARAFLMNPRILIMDDATASVDSETERLIQEAMEEIARDRTTFIIAQRVSTVHKADKIIVLDDGRIAESGAHEELLRLNGIYRRVHDEQFAGEVFL